MLPVFRAGFEYFQHYDVRFFLSEGMVLDAVRNNDELDRSRHDFTFDASQ